MNELGEIIKKIRNRKKVKSFNVLDLHGDKHKDPTHLFKSIHMNSPKTKEDIYITYKVENGDDIIGLYTKCLYYKNNHLTTLNGNETLEKLKKLIE